MKRMLVWLLWQTDIWGGILATRLVKWTGKSAYPIHPKHFLQAEWRTWYLPYIAADDLVLDVGCANGMHALDCAQKCRAVYGFDYNAKQLAIGRAKARELGLTNVQLDEGNVEQPWAFPAAMFDKVIFLDVIEHLHQRELALQECYRVLKPDGQLLISAPLRETSWKRLRGSVGLRTTADPDHKIEYTLAEFTNDLDRAGFRCQSVTPTVYDTPYSGFIDLVGGLSLPLYRRLATWKRNAALRHPAESTGFRIVAEKKG